MNKSHSRDLSAALEAALEAALAGAIILGTAAFLLADPASSLVKTRQHLAGGAGVAERYRSTQAHASDTLLAPRAGVTDHRPAPWFCGH